MLVIEIILSLVFVIIVLSPFFWGAGGKLLEGSYLNNSSTIKQIRSNLLKQYLKEEHSFDKKELTSSEWKKRQEYFIYRYCDLTRRLDFLQKRGQS